MAAKHVTIARTEGVEAGLEAYLAAPSSKLSPNYATIVGNGKRKESTMLTAYCNLFADKIASIRPRVLAERVADDRQSLIEQFEAFMAARNGTTEQIAEAVVAPVSVGITSEEAWVALGSGEKFEPNAERKGEPANNGQLYRLNVLGMLNLNV
jgi:hypothetical protein